MNFNFGLEAQLFLRTAIALNFAVLHLTFSAAAMAEEEVGLNDYYLGQPMQACPDNRPPVTVPGIPPTTCEVNPIQTVAGQPVSSFVVAFGEGRVFAIVAHLPAGERTRLKVRDTLAERYGKAEGPLEMDGSVGYVWKLSGERLVIVEGNSTTTWVQVLDAKEFRRQTGMQRTSPKAGRT